MKKEKIDNRVKYTKMAIENSLLELLDSKPINKITVTEVCNIADINRGTFYKHYLDIYNLIQQIENKLFTEVFSNIENFITSKDKNIYQLSVKLFELLKENKKFVKIIFSENGNKNIIKKLYYKMYENYMVEWKKKNTTIDEKIFDYIFTFTANGSISIIQRWLETGLKESPEEIAKFINQVSEFGFNYFIGNNFIAKN